MPRLKEIIVSFYCFNFMRSNKKEIWATILVWEKKIGKGWDIQRTKVDC